MKFDMTDRVREAWEFFDALLDERIAKISEISEVPKEQIKKINPAEFIEKNAYQTIRNYTFTNIRDWIEENKTDDVYLVSPEDAIEETAAQISYKSGTEIRRTIRASKCQVLPVPDELALDFFIRNHRQSNPGIHNSISNGAIRGKKKEYELVRLSISKGTRIHGGASKLQQACEDTLRQIGAKQIYSYSNATINTGAVYKQLGFKGSRIDGGQPFVIKKNNQITRLINLYPNSTDEALALRGQLKTHLGGNRMWIKEI